MFYNLLSKILGEKTMLKENINFLPIAPTATKKTKAKKKKKKKKKKENEKIYKCE